MNNLKLYGAILGDLAGQPYEFKYKGDYSEFNIHNPNSCFTDDTILTLATAAFMLGKFESFESAYRHLGKRYINADNFGKGFEAWLATPKGTTNDSWGNGCLMRISPLMYDENDEDGKIRNNIIESCFNSHTHTESIIASLTLHELYNFAGMRVFVKNDEFELKKFEKFDVSAKGTIDFIENAYMHSNSTHKTIEAVIKCGGDTDTNASIIGELMNYTFNDLTLEDKLYVESKLDRFLLNILLEFNSKFKN